MRTTKSRGLTYNSWSNTIQRCTNPKHPKFERYGGRGITVCERWRCFKNFHADMGDRPPGCSIDRIDNDGNYEPGNCRWASPKQQANNTRRNRRVCIHKENLTIAEAARRAGVAHSTMRFRIKSGWPENKLLLPPTKGPHEIHFKNQTLSMRGWARHLGIPYPTLQKRLSKGLTLERALSQIS